MSKRGQAITNLGLRSKPGKDDEPPLVYVRVGTPVEILREEGDWLFIRVDGKDGYARRRFVAVLDK